MCKLMMIFYRQKQRIDEHFPKVVWVAGHGEEAVSDEALPGAEDHKGETTILKTKENVWVFFEVSVS